MSKRRQSVAALLLAFVCASAPHADARNAARGARVDDLIALHDLGGPYAELAVSPDGTTAAVLERRADLDGNDYRYTVVAIDIASGAAREIADAGRFVLRSDNGRFSGVGIMRRPQFSSDSRFVLYLRENAGAVEIWRAGVSGAGGETLVRGEGDVRRFRIAGDRVVFETSTPRTALREDIERGRRQGFAVDDRFSPSYALTPLPDTDRQVQTWTLDLATNQTAAADESEAALLDSGPRPHVRPLDPALIVDEPPIGVFDDTGTQCRDPVCSGPITHTWQIAPPNEPHSVVFRRLEGHARRITSLYVWRPRDQSARRLFRTEARIDGCSPTSVELICLEDCALQPRRVVAVDWRSGQQRTLYDPNPQWREIARPRVERFEFEDQEGNQSFAHLVYPLDWRAGSHYPLVVVQYRSRGFLLGGVGDEFPIFPLSANGYFVLDFDRPEFRERGQRMNMAQIQREVELGGIERSAKREALMHLIERALARGADRDRIAITGLSDGAETAYAMLMDEPIFAAAVISTPPTEPMSWPLQSQSAREFFFARTGLTGPWDEGPEPWRSWWRANAPIFHTEQIRAPILFSLAEAEALRAFPLMTRLRERSAPYDAYLYPGAYHLKWRPAHLRAAQQRTLDWLDFWLRNIEREDSAEPGRLERWRALRALKAADSP